MRRFISMSLAFVTCAALTSGVFSLPVSAAEKGIGAPTTLRTDDLTTPLGLDDQTPHFAWQLNDLQRGARQSAYQLQVATSRELLTSGKPDTWDSGRIASGQSVGVNYQGGSLAPSKCYFWRVLAWDKDGKPYPSSEISWWETGLLSQENWRGNQANQAKWIGYQTWEEAAVRTAGASWITTADGEELAKIKTDAQHIGYRLRFTIGSPVKQAILFVTGEDVASAWIDGAQVTKGEPLPPWKQLPWKKYKQVDVTSQVRAGSNLLAVEVTHYVVNPNGMATGDTAPMSATLVAQLTDGTIVHFVSGASSNWKA